MSHTTIRRKDRAIYDDDWLSAFLHRAPVVSISFCKGQQPDLKPSLFVYDAQRHAIYFHASPLGRTMQALQAKPRATLMAFEMGRLLPHHRASSFSLEYASVVASGIVSIIDEADEATAGLQMLLDKYFPHLKSDEDYSAIEPERMRATAVFRLDIEEWAGKQKKVADDFPGAFMYPYTPAAE